MQVVFALTCHVIRFSVKRDSIGVLVSGCIPAVQVNGFVALLSIPMGIARAALAVIDSVLVPAPALGLLPSIAISSTQVEIDGTASLLVGQAAHYRFQFR